MNPNPFSLLKNFTVPVAISTSLSLGTAAHRDVPHAPRSGLARHEFRVRSTAWRSLIDLSIDAAALTVAPSDECCLVANVERVLGTQRDVGQEDRDRVRRVTGIWASQERAASRFDPHGCRLATEGAWRSGVHGGHDAIASRKLVTPRRRRSILAASIASLARIRSSSRSRRASSLPISRRRSSSSWALRARTKQRCASTARSSSNRRAIAENEFPASRRARTWASSSGAVTRCLRDDPPRSGLDIDRFLDRGLCVCLGTEQQPIRPQGADHALNDVGLRPNRANSGDLERATPAVRRRQGPLYQLSCPPRGGIFSSRWEGTRPRSPGRTRLAS